MRSASILLSIPYALAIIACGEPTTTPPADAGHDAPMTPPVDAGVELDAGPPDGGCDVSPIPDPLPAIAGGFMVDDADGGTIVPPATGGDPTGVWVFEDATFYVGPAAASMFDVESSTVTGTAWASFDGTEARLDYRFETTLRGTLAGTLIRPSSTQIRGTYVVDGVSIDITPICAQTTAMETGGGGAGLDFSIDGDNATLISRLSGGSGTITIVLQGTRRTTP